ncbi:MAG: hypothetical protein UT61_C0025G0021 [Candidatus Woesebacteria bacterium GW2011_GWA1_39_8]|uniref:Glycosyltransferase 2-like domain-containing protein n=1 Tax=Candidatus Woesebacteria bacterium GW2011_GWA1_39_8 TaxID=1618552 RepID=A0A0G0PNA1_9BACT|nr:MAG: hypothetical protein UT61_C0025G0021 [Candidatus Woesebacteria bacterium GW2011_GWA1_39_8]
MPSYLSAFPGSATNRKQKFIRAVDSFLRNSYPEKELIIISDGCHDTIDICKKRYKEAMKSKRINLIELPEHYGFQGKTRQAGIDAATGDIITQLDSDDFFLYHHLKSIVVNFDTKKYDWVYFNHFIKPDTLDIDGFWYVSQLEEGKICNANYAYKRSLDVTWNNCDGREDNKFFTKQLIDKFPRVCKIYGCGYVVCNQQIIGVTA